MPETKLRAFYLWITHIFILQKALKVVNAGQCSHFTVCLKWLKAADFQIVLGIIKGLFTYYVIIYDLKNLVAFGHKQSWRPLAANKGSSDSSDAVAIGHNQLWRPLAAKLCLWFQENDYVICDNPLPHRRNYVTHIYYIHLMYIGHI